MKQAYLGIANDVEQSDDVGTASQVLENLDLSLDLLLLDGLEDLDDAFLVIDDVDAFKDFRIFSATCTQRATTLVNHAGPTQAAACFATSKTLKGDDIPILRTTS